VIHAAIFDVDGTLIDSVDLHAKSWQDTLRHFGHEVAYARIRRQIGKGSDQFLPEFLSPEEVRDRGGEISEYRVKWFKDHYLHLARSFPYVRELLTRIKSDGKRIVLASSAKGDELEAYKKIIGCEDLLDEETSADDAEASKPEPDIFIAALKRLNGVDPGEVLVVGDTPWDASAANKAKLRTIGMLSGGFAEDDLRAAGCIAIFKSPGDLLTRYVESPFHKL
jgi:HAD superfamily hydrolase (TIGR01549 family)